MGISNVAVKTFDSSGTQSLCRTNEYSGDEKIKSSFISKCDRLYISGSGETVIPGNLSVFPTTNSTDTFNINSDTDAISDIIFNIELKLKRPSGTGAWDANVCKDIILAMINKVEIKTGSLTAQTLTADDIYIRNLTELGQPFTFSAPFDNVSATAATTGSAAENRDVLRQVIKAENERNVWKHYNTDQAAVLVIQAACSIPFMGRSKDMSRSLLQAGALTNAITVKVYYNNIYISNSLAKDSDNHILSAGDGSSDIEFLDKSYFKSFITVKTHIISETEKNFISKNIIHKVLNTSANVTKDIPKISTITTGPSDGVTDVLVNLENVSFNVSHLLIGIRLPHVNNKKLSVNTSISVLPYDMVLQDRTLENQLSTPFSVIDGQTFYKPSTNVLNLFGYMPNAIESMELVIGSDRTGFIKGASAKIGGCENFTLLNSDKNSAHYIITLAEKAFDTSGISFSKCSNKKLLIKLNNSIFENAARITPNPLSSSNFPQNAVITVTACGTKVQTVVGGSMSFM